VAAALGNAAPGSSPSVDVTNAANTIGQGGIASAQDVLAGDTPVAQALSEANAPAPAGQQPSTFNEQASPGMFDAPTFSFGQNAPAPATNLQGPEGFGDPTTPWPGPAQGQGPLGGPTSPTAPDPNTPSGIPGNMGQVTPSPDQSGFNLGSLLGITPANAASLGPNENLMPQGPANPGLTMTGQGPTTETIISPWDAGAATIEPYPGMNNPFNAPVGQQDVSVLDNLAAVGQGVDPSQLTPAPAGQAAGVPAAGQPYPDVANNPFTGPAPALSDPSQQTTIENLANIGMAPSHGTFSLVGGGGGQVTATPASTAGLIGGNFNDVPDTVVQPTAVGGFPSNQIPGAQYAPGAGLSSTSFDGVPSTPPALAKADSLATPQARIDQAAQRGEFDNTLPLASPTVADNVPTPTPRPDTAPQIPGTQGPSPFDTAQFPVGPGGAPSTQAAPPSPDTTRPPGVVDAGPTKTVTEAPSEGPGGTTTPEVIDALNSADGGGGGGTPLPPANAAISPQALIQPIPGAAPAADGGGGTPAAPSAFVPPGQSPLEDINFGNINPPNAGLFGIPGLPGGATGVPGGIPGPPPPPSAFDALNNAVDTGP
jgi:hypothetical protein